ncbi:hypothetical protein [Ruegeria sp. R14_0]|uniref:hypothetical protein n=1 Tax=Ruegeria sp. R14_0 TaxID=2821100 RepID=UPI001AD98FDF|nr:hypothetical protein [Ruegeria sp. R14_0]MBO9447287.1 hypothetical protein [Ruegeria sp. R14_0]
MHLEHGKSESRPANGAVAIANRERQICDASNAAKSAFAVLTSAAGFSPEMAETQHRVYQIFRWYFLSAYCSRMLTDAAHRLEHHTLQVSMDVHSAVRMSLSEAELEAAMVLVQDDATTMAAARANKIGCRGHSAGWTAATLQQRGREVPAEIKKALSGALSASVRLN